jgi:hypothetical protein
MSCFTTVLHLDHYLALKTVCHYLHVTKSWGLYYWHPQPNDLLPDVPFTPISADPTLPSFPTHDLLHLVGYVNAAHATNIKTHCSISGMVFTLAGGAVTYKSKLQPTISTSSTEAEFITAVSAAKTAKYLCSILSDLGIPQPGPTPLYKDNQAAISMINDQHPTPHSRHANIQHFAIQEWCAADAIKMVYILTAVNPVDQSTKALGWTIHSHHAHHTMGHFGLS